MLDANAAHIALLIEGATTDLQVLSFTGREALNTPFCFELELVSERANLPLETLLHKPALLTFGGMGTGKIHGQVYTIAQGESGHRLTHYHLSLRPRIAWLAHRVNQRIFQQMTVQQIITQVLEEHGILADAYQFNLDGVYAPRTYCTQYDETDLHFIQRLAEEDGLSFYFDHSEQGHLLVFGDGQRVFKQLAPLAYQPDSGMVPERPVVSGFGARLETRTTRVARRDYNYTKPLFKLEGGAKSIGVGPDLEDYDYPGRFEDGARGQRLATQALERHRSDYRLAKGKSDQPLLLSGHFLPLTDHGNEAWNDLWLLTDITHEGRQPQVLEQFASHSAEAAPDGFRQGYRNHFQATPWDVIYRPALDHPKPKVLGSQSAVVTGPVGEEIYVDALGRIKIQFHWDREGQSDAHTSCWVRVASNWAGQNFGAISLPRVGMEVLVNYLEGDPDQPIVTSCLFHSVHMPPYKLPDFKTVATLKSKEYKGSRGNELRIDDTTSEISIALRSDHAASALNLGYLTHPRPAGGQARGEGFELRTDLQGALRAAGGLLLTTEPRLNESKHHKDLPETAERLATASDQQDGFSIQAREVQAQEAGDQDEVAKALQRQQQGILGTGPNLTGSQHPEFSEPHLVMASPAGIALTTANSTHIASGEHLALSSTGHTSLAIGKRLLASASQGMRLFVQNLGWRLVAASGDIDIRALKDSVNVLAKLNITASADRITLTAKTELVIQGGGSATTYNAGGITHTTSGPYTAHAANFVYTGAKSCATAFPEAAKPSEGNLELLNQYANLQGFKAGAFEVVDALGMHHTGVLDAHGFASVSGTAPGPARVMFGVDPADTWSEASVIAKTEWPREPASFHPIVQAQSLTDSTLAQAKNRDGVMRIGRDLAQTGHAAAPSALSLRDALQTGSLPTLPAPSSVLNKLIP